VHEGGAAGRALGAPPQAVRRTIFFALDWWEAVRNTVQLLPGDAAFLYLWEEPVRPLSPAVDAVAF
jgi:hypothetical protein